MTKFFFGAQKWKVEEYKKGINYMQGFSLSPNDMMTPKDVDCVEQKHSYLAQKHQKCLGFLDLLEPQTF